MVWWMWTSLYFVVGCGGGEPGEVPLSDTGMVDTDTGADTGTPVDTADTDTDEPESRRTVVVAQGHVGRTVRSCDGGRTWVDDQSADDALRCWQDNWQPDCDHRADTARGVVFAEDSFLATFGWGYPGGFHRSGGDGVWSVVLPEVAAAALAYGDGVVIGGSGAPFRSEDGGHTWTQQPYFIEHNVRHTAYVDGRFFLLNDGLTWVSDDGGLTWWQPLAEPGCESFGGTLFSGGIAGVDGVILAVNWDGRTCRSLDRGASFHPVASVGAEVGSRLLVANGRFEIWRRGTRYHTVDGEQWTATPTAPVFDIDNVVVLPEGGYVAIGGWYAEQQAWTSGDGVQWQASEDFVGGHPVTSMAAGALTGVCD